ncbi:MAG: anhydro-N-acetylmuramic acid kinase [Sulfuritalea sp.]|jgi:anhydro-N-acetylmuramic acid kinase|nr:anhydro-N-acetylmuramic acid kinase [Sulfuritalea sp.]
MASPVSLVAGLMSGTSLDGVDAALVDFSAGQPRTLATFWLPYPATIRQQALQLQAAQHDEIHSAALLANELARSYAEAVRQVLASAGVDAAQVAAIGCHGQTIRHRPAAGYSVQLNNPALLAELAGITVVADFRSRDIAAGGQGAPLVPAFHAAAFGDPERHRAILNVGGIANLTDLNPGQPVRGFDCGPGNLLMDAWIEHHQGLRYDEAGNWARQGSVLPELLHGLLKDAFFSTSPPKSCGRDEFNTSWLARRLAGSERPENVQATLLELTAVSATQAIGRWCGSPRELFVCGGGARNQALMARLQHHLPNCRVASTDSLGQPADWVEAVAFAWLAWRTLHGEPGNLAEVTGARGPRVLGAIYPR